MPVLNRKNGKKLFLPSTKDAPEADKAYVVIKEKLKLKDVAAINEAISETDKAIVSITSMIIEWNYQDEDGTALPITMDNVGELEVEDFVFLTQELKSIVNAPEVEQSVEEKKTSSDTLMPSINPTEIPRA